MSYVEYTPYCRACGAGTDTAREKCSYCLTAYALPLSAPTSESDSMRYKVSTRYEFGATDVRRLYGAPSV